MSLPHPRLCLLWLTAAAAGYGVRVNPGSGALADSAPPMASKAGAAASGQPALVKGPHRQYLDPLIHAGAEDMRGFFEKYEGIPDPSERRAALRGLVARWVELDPRGALEFFTARNLRGEVAALLVQWALVDLDAVANVLQPPGFPLLSPYEVLEPLASNNGKAALELMEALAKRAPMEGWAGSLGRLQGVLGRTALWDFEATLKIWREIPDTESSEKQAILGEIAKARAMTDPADALTWARSMGKNSDRVVEEVLRVMACREPVRAAIGLMNTPGLRNSLVPGSSAGFLAESIAKEWGRTNPPKALAWISEITGNEPYERHFVRETAKAILSEALSDPENLKSIFNSVRSYLDADAPNFPSHAPPNRTGAVLEIVESIPSGPERDRLLASLAARAPVDDPVDTLKWLEKISDPKARETFAQRLLIPPGPDAAAQARRVYDALPPDLRIASAGRLAEVQAAADAPAAAAWARSLTDEAAGAKAMEAALAQWTHDAASEASGWADSLPEGRARDAAAAGIAAGIVAREPSSAFAWAMSIRDPAQQELSLGMTLDYWRGNDRAAAVSALNAAVLPDGLRTRLLRAVNSNQGSIFNP